MIYILDTNSLSDLKNGNVATRTKLIREVRAATVVTTIVSVGEIRYGIDLLDTGHRQSELSRKLDDVLELMEAIDLPVAAAFPYGKIKARMEKRGRAICDNDLWIAATAILLDATLVTRDRDFEAIDTLRRVDWSVTSP